MMKFYFSLLVTLLSFCSITAQVTTNTELKNLINASFKYFPKIKEIENTVKTAEQKIEITKINVPIVNGYGSYNYIRPKIVVPLGGGDFQFAAVHNVNTYVDASYNLYDFGRIKANVERAKDDLKFSKDNVLSAKMQLANQVSIIYYNIVYVQKSIQIQDSVLAYLKDNLQITNSKLKNGDALRIDVLNIQAQIDAELNRKEDLKNNLQKQYNILEYTTNNKQTNGAAFDFELPLQDGASLLASAQINNAEFLLTNDKTKEAKSDLAIVKLVNKPSVEVHANTGFRNSYVPNIAEDRFNYLAGIGVKIPIYDGYKNRKQIKLNENLVLQNELALATLKNTYKKDIDQALTDVVTNLERIKNMKGQIEQTKAAQLLATTRFKNGVGTNIEITNASTNVQRAELTKLQYEYQLCLAKLELARLGGYVYW